MWLNSIDGTRDAVFSWENRKQRPCLWYPAVTTVASKGNMQAALSAYRENPLSTGWCEAWSRSAEIHLLFQGKLQCCCQWVVPIASKAYSSLLGIAPLFLSEYCLYAARRRLFWAMYGEICCAGEEIAVRRKIYVISWGQCEERIRVVSPLSTADWIRPASCILFTKISYLLFICAFAQCAWCGNLWVLQFLAFSF